LLDRLAVAGRGGAAFDLVASYAALLPAMVIAEILGVPPALVPLVLEWSRALTPSLDLGLTLRQYCRIEAATRRGNAWLRGHLRRLRVEPGDDLFSQLVHAANERGRLSEAELVATAGLLLAAGFETTAGLLGTGTLLLIRHPDQRRSLGTDPLRWRAAVEEMLRYESPAQCTSRVCRTGTVLAGVPVRRGQVVVVMLAGANRDPAVFVDPDRFDVTRRNAREHLSFSAGPHYCLGAALARMEGEIGLRALFARYPGLALAGEPRRGPGRNLRTYESVPVRLTSGA
jgi:cytochrome P450